MAGQHYCLRWNNYQSNMTSVFHQLLRNEAFVDVTLACNDSSLKAHKVVLSACSSYFQKLLLENPCKHPTIIMPQDVCFSDLKFIIEFVYRGEIDVSQAELQSLLKTADQLKIKGLCEVSDSKDGTANSPGAEVTTLPILSRRSFTKLRRLSFSKKHRLNTNNNNLNNGENRRSSFKSEPPNDSSPPPPPPPLTPQHMSSPPLPHPQQPSTPTTPTTPTSSSSMQSHQHSLPLHQTHHSHQQMHPIHQLQEGTYSPQLDHLETNSMASHLLVGGVGPELARGSGSSSEHNSVATSTETETVEDDVPVAVLEAPLQQQQLSQQQHTPGQEHSPGMLMGPSMNSLDGGGGSGSTGPPSSGGATDPGADVDLQPETQPTGPQATLVENMDLSECSPHDSHHDLQDSIFTMGSASRKNTPVHQPATKASTNTSDCHRDDVKVKFETLRAMEQAETIDIDSHMSERTVGDDEHSMHTMVMITPELLGLIPSNSGHNGDPGPSQHSSASLPSENTKGTPKTWTQEDMELALDALRNHHMSLTKASATYGIPSTTLWQRAHRLGIDTPKKEGPSKTWTEDSLNSALEALRTGSISANKASKAYGIPSSTLYKIARREGIRLSAPFNAAPTTWNSDDLERALESIRSGQTSVQRASTEYGIPTGTLYGRCKREGIELSRSNPTPWSEDAMTEALEAVRIGQMSINQAAIHYNLPYSSLYGRFKRVKYEAEGHHSEDIRHHQHVSSPPPPQPQIMVLQYQQQPPPHAMFQQHAAS